MHVRQYLFDSSRPKCVYYDEKKMYFWLLFSYLLLWLSHLVEQ